MSEIGSLRQQVNDIMPTMLSHEGVWEGVYTHVGVGGCILDQHNTRVECIFPDTGPYAYIQKNHFTWDNGKEYRAELLGTLKDNKLWWDNEKFSGCSWETDHGQILLNLERKDEPGSRFYEMISIGSTGKNRARTWQWFNADGELYKRTLCDEHLVSRY